MWRTGELLKVFQYRSNKTQRYIVYLYLETSLHISGGISTHYQERIQLYLQHLLFVTPLLLSGAIVEELEPVWVCCGWRTPDAVDTLVCAPDDGWKYHPKHVEHFPDINKLCNVASCWIFIGIYLRCTDPWRLNLLIILTNGRWDLTRRLKG
jgi:hypothetical protein